MVNVTLYITQKPPLTGVQQNSFYEKYFQNSHSAGKFKVNNRNTRTRCEICSKLTIKIPEDAIG